MTLSPSIRHAVENSSWIRKMFEEGTRLKAQVGADKVFDLSIGNPVFDPPASVRKALIQLLSSGDKGQHRYMPNAGFESTRSWVATQLNRWIKEYAGPNTPPMEYTQADILMCVGAAGGLNVTLRTICGPGDEVIVIKPYFAEYLAYIENWGAKSVIVGTRPDFHLDLEQIAKAITPRTRALLLNSPNNPTGVVYPREDLDRLGQLLEQQSQLIGHPISLVTDEPYQRITFDGKVVPRALASYANTILVTSYSKDLALAGERIGYIAVSPLHAARKELQAGLPIALRILGFVNAPALMQRVLPLAGDALVDMAPYQENRDLLYNHLTSLGFECVKPEGAFYLFPKCLIADDLEFVREAQNLHLLLVPGRGFGMPGYFRVSFCFETELIKRVLPVFTELTRRLRS